MYKNIPPDVAEQMALLEAIDLRDREDGTVYEQRLRQITPDTGRFLALIAAAAPSGPLVEIGTSGGYSGLWLSLACRERGVRLTTFDVSEYKFRMAQETFTKAGVSDWVEAVHGDALELLPRFSSLAFCFLDTEKSLYPICYDLVVPRLITGGILVADNLLSHQAELQSFSERVEADDRVDALIVPVGKGLLVCRKIHRS